MYDNYNVGKYSYKPLPKEIDYSPEILQQRTNNLFRGFEFICAYIDNLLILIKGDWIYHVHKLEWTLNKPKGKGLECNIERSFLEHTKMEYLCFWVKKNGVKPIDKKIGAITNMKSPISPK